MLGTPANAWTKQQFVGDNDFPCRAFHVPLLKLWLWPIATGRIGSRLAGEIDALYGIISIHFKDGKVEDKRTTTILKNGS